MSTTVLIKIQGVFVVELFLEGNKFSSIQDLEGEDELSMSATASTLPYSYALVSYPVSADVQEITKSSKLIRYMGVP